MKTTESKAAAVGSGDLLGKCPAKELRDLIEGAVAEAKGSVQHFVHEVDHGSIKRLTKWRRRLLDREKCLAWLDQHFPNSVLSKPGLDNSTP